MEFRNTLGALMADADELRALLGRLEKSESLSAIELDLVLEKLRHIYDLVLEIRTEVKPAEKDITDKKATESTFDKNEPVPEIISEDPKELQEKSAEDKQAKDQWKEATRQQITKELKEQQSPHKEPEQKRAYVSDRFKTSNPTLNEELGGKGRGDDLSSKLVSKPISNITGAIGLNEKFELIKELFGGDKEMFERTVQVLNMAGSFVEAYNYLKDNFDWDMDSQYVQRLLELIRRKLIVRRDDR